MGRGMLRLGIIGAGIMGERLLRAAQEHAAEIVEVSGIWDQQGAALDRVGAIGGVRTAGSAHEVIQGAECIYIATPPASHLEYAAQALAAGKAVFLEKPLAVDLAAADAFVR